MNYPKIKGYLILEHRTTFGLIGEVEQHIELGWQPIGGPFQLDSYSDADGIGIGYAQAMITEEE